MSDSTPDLGEIYLQPGELFIAHEPTIIRTLLGSCVGVAFWNRRLGVGALCHAMLPRCPEEVSRETNPTKGFRYVDFCIRHIARRFEELGAHRSEIEVKIFGGADVLLAGSESSAKDTVGSLNCNRALEVLDVEGFRISASSVRGASGVTIYFNTGNGEVLLRRIQQSRDFEKGVWARDWGNP